MLRYIVETQTVIMGDSKGKGKQWRYVRTKIRNLLKLGTHPGVAIPMSLSRKGPWRCARTTATQTGMTNQWLKDQGLLSVKELWVNTCHAVAFLV